LFERKVKATDRTKTPEEIAKNEADRLHELETKRLARMNNDFENDDLSDVSDDEDDKRNRKRKAKATKTKNPDAKNPDELDDESDEEDDKDKLEARFTADGLVYLDSDGKVVSKLGDEEEGSESPDIVEQDETNESEKEDESGSEDEENDSLGNSEDEASVASAESDEEDQLGDTDPNYDPTSTVLEVGAKIKGNYRAHDQFEGKQTWYNGTISVVHTDPKTANITYDVTYDDGDFEDGIGRENVRPILKKTEEVNIEEQKKLEARKLKMKRIKAKTKARYAS
jgi:nucleolar protein 14